MRIQQWEWKALAALLAMGSMGCPGSGGGPVRPITVAEPLMLDTASNTLGLDSTKVPVVSVCGGGQVVQKTTSGWTCVTPAPGSGPASWSSITDKPAAFPAAPHAHAWSEVTDKPTVFPAAPHTHDFSDITGIGASTAWPGTVPWSRVSQTPAFALSSSVSAVEARVAAAEGQLTSVEGRLIALEGGGGSGAAGPVVMSLKSDDAALTGAGYALSGLGRAESFTPRSATLAPTSYLQGAAVLGTKVYMAGGYNGSGQPCVPNLQEFDLATGQWTARQPMGSPRYTHSLVGARGKVYAIGGYCGTGLRSMEIYDPSTDAWTGGASLPDHNHYAAAHGVLSDGKLHVVGGHDHTSTNATSRTHVVYDFDSNSWGTAREIPAARYWAASGVLPDGRLIVAGGHDGSSCRSETYIYNPSQDTWAQVASMPGAVHSLQGAVIAGRFHTFGGHNCSAHGNWHYVYDPGTGKWSTAAPLPYSAYTISVAPLRGGALLIGGWSSSALTSVYEYLAPLYLYGR